jgi:hypothetical protein
MPDYLNKDPADPEAMAAGTFDVSSVLLLIPI